MRQRRFIAALALVLTSCPSFPDDVDVSTPDQCDPIWLWTGPPDQAPSCPPGHPLRWDGWKDAKITDACGACECGPAACVMPSGVTTHSGSCQGGPADPIGLPAPNGWDGSCLAAPAAIPAHNFASVTYD